jgi:carboxymethylenebutenolidase
VTGYRVGSGAKTVVLIHEIFGLNVQMRQMADRIAEAGFTAFAIDLFNGRTTDELQQGFALAGALDWQMAVQSIGAAVRELSDKPAEDVALLGFCLGGSLALVAAASLPLRACVSYYGIPPADKADLTRIGATVLGHFATRDIYIANDRVDAFAASLARAGVRAEICRYDGEHGFVREQPGGAATEQSWARTLAFLREELSRP